MGTRPSFQFYPADWRASANLRRCTVAARGGWIDILCVFHDSNEYGLVRWPLKELAAAAELSLKNANQLVSRCVLKGADSNFAGFSYTPTHAGCAGEPVLLIPPCDGSCWYSSRMVVDEWRRKQRGASTRFTTENNPRSRHQPDGSVNGRVTHQPDGWVARLGDGPSSSTSSSEVTNTDRESKTDRVVVSAETATRRIVGTRWGVNDHVSQQWVEDARDKRSDLGLADADLSVEAEMFENYWASKAGAAATKLDWHRTWINWSLKAQGNGHGRRKATAHDNFFAAAAGIIRRAEEREAAGNNGADIDSDVIEEDDRDQHPAVQTGAALLASRLHGKAG